MLLDRRGSLRTGFRRGPGGAGRGEERPSGRAAGWISGLDSGWTGGAAPEEREAAVSLSRTFKASWIAAKVRFGRILYPLGIVRHFRRLALNRTEQESSPNTCTSSGRATAHSVGIPRRQAFVNLRPNLGSCLALSYRLGGPNETGPIKVFFIIVNAIEFTITRRPHWAETFRGCRTGNLPTLTRNRSRPAWRRGFGSARIYPVLVDTWSELHG